MHNKIIFSIAVGIFIIGLTQFNFAEEDLGETSYIEVDKEKFNQPESKYDHLNITITGHVKDYMRGENITIVIINPHEGETEINTFGSKKGKIYTFFEITENSHIGVHQIILKHRGGEVAATSFEILEN